MCSMTNHKILILDNGFKAHKNHFVESVKKIPQLILQLFTIIIIVKVFILLKNYL